MVAVCCSCRALCWNGQSQTKETMRVSKEYYQLFINSIQMKNTSVKNIEYIIRKRCIFMETIFSRCRPVLRRCRKCIPINCIIPDTSDIMYMTFKKSVHFLLLWYAYLLPLKKSYFGTRCYLLSKNFLHWTYLAWSIRRVCKFFLNFNFWLH